MSAALQLTTISMSECSFGHSDGTRDRAATSECLPPQPGMDHIRATPGFPNGSWPHEMSLSDNLRDLERHAQDFAERRGFTYTVLSTGTGDVIGCVYIYPPRGESEGGTSAGEQRAAVSSWVRADRAELDPVLYHRVREWLERDWPFHSIQYAPRV